MSRRRKKRVSRVRYKKEFLGILLLALFLFLSFSFLTHNPTDNSWFYFSSDKREVFNWCGIAGAHVSALFFFLLGGASYVLLFSLFMFSLFLFRAGKVSPSRKAVPFRGEILRISALPVLVISSSLILRIQYPDIIVADSGGIIGVFVDSCLRPLFGKAGTVLVGYISSLFSALLIARISLVQFVSTTSYALFTVASKLVRFSLALFAVALENLRKKKAQPFARGATVFDTQDDLSALMKKKAHPSAKVHTSPVLRKEEIKKNIVGEKRRGFLGYDLFYMRNTLSQEIDCYAQAKGVVPLVYELPDFSKFQEHRVKSYDPEHFEKRCRERGKKLEEKLERFGIIGCVTAIRPGPIVTLFEYKPDIDSKISKIISLEDDLAMALTALSIRIIAPIPGRNVIGFEISNSDRQDVFLADILKADQVKNFSGLLPLAFGTDITGNPVVYDLVSMPHILVAGSTGSGKSVGLNSMLISLLCRCTPDELKLILIDPKRLEFAPYSDIPHLLFPIITNPRKAIPVLKWVVQEMEDRYDLMSKVGVRNIVDYRRKGFSPLMPFIVLIIDELADLMMVAGKDVETQIARTAQMARAAGIHMIVATQRPSVDILTGVIKVNFPARIAFRVSSKIDSRTIIDSTGAEKLLGRGDMLFLDSGSSVCQRIHGAYVSGSEISLLTNYLRKQREINYLDVNEVLRKKFSFGEELFEDELYDEIRIFVKTVDEVSISMMQRKYRIGFNRSARIMEKLEMDGLVAPSRGGKMRKVIH
jgi:S-DNA-T family DNA segregation ATPase FtsK/SpoIIIE